MWDFIWWLLLVPYVLSCVGLIVIVLLQKGKGVGFAGAFGVGAGSETVFGPRASKSLPQRLTYIMAGVFMLLALIMSIVAGRLGKGSAPEKLSEDAAATATAPETPQVPTGTLDDLGSALKDTAPTSGNETTAVSVTPPPAEEQPPLETPAAPAPAPAAPAPAPAEAPAAPAGTPAAPAAPASN